MVLLEFVGVFVFWQRPLEPLVRREPLAVPERSRILDLFHASKLGRLTVTLFALLCGDPGRRSGSSLGDIAPGNRSTRWP